MSLKRKLKESIPERLNPGDNEPERCSPGSIEQKLDMCEEGDLRGDDILFEHGRTAPRYSGDPKELDELMVNENFNVDLSETDREGDELSGDEHSAGLEGDFSASVAQEEPRPARTLEPGVEPARRERERRK